jgi:hypothetical protein
VEFAEAILAVLSPPLHGLAGIGESLEDALTRRSNEDFRDDYVAFVWPSFL